MKRSGNPPPPPPDLPPSGRPRKVVQYAPESQSNIGAPSAPPPVPTPSPVRGIHENPDQVTQELKRPFPFQLNPQQPPPPPPRDEAPTLAASEWDAETSELAPPAAAQLFQQGVALPTPITNPIQTAPTPPPSLRNQMIGAPPPPSHSPHLASTPIHGSPSVSPISTQPHSHSGMHQAGPQSVRSTAPGQQSARNTAPGSQRVPTAPGTSRAPTAPGVNQTNDPWASVPGSYPSQIQREPEVRMPVHYVVASAFFLAVAVVGFGLWLAFAVISL